MAMLRLTHLLMSYADGASGTRYTWFTRGMSSLTNHCGTQTSCKYDLVCSKNPGYDLVCSKK